MNNFPDTFACWGLGQGQDPPQYKIRKDMGQFQVWARDSDITTPWSHLLLKEVQGLTTATPLTYAVSLVVGLHLIPLPVPTSAHLD